MTLNKQSVITYSCNLCLKRRMAIIPQSLNLEVDERGLIELVDTHLCIEGAEVDLFSLNYYRITGGYTNVDGFYNLTGIGAATYIVSASADGYVWDNTYITIDYDGEGEYWLFYLDPIFIPGTGFIDVYVYGMDTLAPIEDAYVDLFNDDWYWITGGLTNVDGFYNFTGLGAATYIIEANAADYEWNEAYVTIDYDGEGESITIFLPPSFVPGDGFIDTYVYNNDKHNPIEGAEVRLYDEYDNFVDMGYTDISGFYNFTGLGVSGYRIEAEASGYEYNESYVIIDYDGEGEYLMLYLEPIVHTLNILYPSDSQTVEGGSVLIGFDASEPHELETIDVYVNAEYITTVTIYGGPNEFIVPVFENGTNTIYLLAYYSDMSMASDTVDINSINVIPNVYLKEGDILRYRFLDLQYVQTYDYNFTFTTWLSTFEMLTHFIIHQYDAGGTIMLDEFWLTVNVLNGYVSMDDFGAFEHGHFFAFSSLLPSSVIGDKTSWVPWIHILTVNGSTAWEYTEVWTLEDISGTMLLYVEKSSNLLYYFQMPGLMEGILLETTIDFLNPDISDVADFGYTIGDTGNVISWVATDMNPSTYTIYEDSTLIVDSEEWLWTTMIIDVDGLAEGTYTYVIIVMDLAGNSAQDTVTVTVHPIVPELSPMLNLLFLPSILCMTLVFVLKRKKIPKTN